MRLPWSSQRKRDLEELERSQKHLEAVRKQWPIVIAVSQALHGHRDRNHFAEGLAAIFRGEQQ